MVVEVAVYDESVIIISLTNELGFALQFISYYNSTYVAFHGLVKIEEKKLFGNEK